MRQVFWVAECPSLPGCISQGETKKSAIKNIREAIEDYVHGARRVLRLPQMVNAHLNDALWRPRHHVLPLREV